ncbi:MAG: 50S ribosomal protein L25, partial [Acidimicrobiales bacterium]
MAEIKVAAEVGRPIGSRPARRLRRDGRIPGVIYGHGIDPLPVAVEARSLRAALTTEAGLNALLAIEVDGTSHLTLAREIQRHPVRGSVSHVDFQVVRRDEVVTSDVPINLVGEAAEVHKGDGMVEQQLFSLSVQAVPAAIPNIIEVDISDLTIGQAIRVVDIVLPQGASTELDP